LAEFVFTALASGTSPLTLQNVILLDSNLSDITASATVQNAAVMVNGAVSSVPEPASMLLLIAGFLLLVVCFKFRLRVI
jgi:hypothetical protein